jgi:hypothetical protein
MRLTTSTPEVPADSQQCLGTLLSWLIAQGEVDGAGDDAPWEWWQQQRD